MRNRTSQFAGVFCLTLMLAAMTSASATANSKSKAPSTSSKHSSSTHASSKKHSSKSGAKGTKTASRSHGQRGIDAERTQAIQTALIREHYLGGEPSGNWDSATKEALVKYQAANGWQTKITPDSRALIKLGLGPDHKGLLNPETASIPSPHELGVNNGAQPGGAADQQ